MQAIRASASLLKLYLEHQFPPGPPQDLCALCVIGALNVGSGIAAPAVGSTETSFVSMVGSVDDFGSAQEVIDSSADICNAFLIRFSISSRCFCVFMLEMKKKKNGNKNKTK